jgi:hypothetical protein
MTYYEITDILFDVLKDSKVGFTTITHGSIDDVDLARQTIYPLAHVTPSTATIGERTITYNMNIAVLDIVDFNKKDLRDQLVPYEGIDNQMDVLSDLLVRLQIAADVINRKLDLNNVDIDMNINCTPFVDRFENKLAGWETTFVVTLPSSAVNQGAC